MATRVRSYSKINLGLAIGPPRADGFHGLVTLYQTLALHDWVTVEERAAQVPRAGEPSRIYADNESSAGADGRAQYRMEDGRAGARRGWAWRPESPFISRRRYPCRAAGGGSANAAAALIGLERELEIEVPDRFKVAAGVGSDVPLFLVGGVRSGEGRGEVVTAMPDLPATWCVVAVPEVGVSTPRAFQEWDGLCSAKAARKVVDPTSQNRDMGHPSSDGLTSPAEPDRLEELSHAYASIFGVHPASVPASDTSGIRGAKARPA